jgi:hypothetical protein
MKQVPLDLPLRPGEAAEIAGLIFEHAEGKRLTDELRNRLAMRAALLKLETLTPYFGSLARDPVHPAAYYLAVDAAGAPPLLLHLALSTAPTSSIFSHALLIGRTRRMQGPEFIMNAIPFASEDRENVERFVTCVDSAFLPRPQGSRASITVASDFPRAFEIFRTVQKRTGKNLAAIAGDYHAGLWAAIRAGWRQEYSVAAEIVLDADVAVQQTFPYTRFGIDVSAREQLETGLRAAEYAHEEIRQARALLKIGGVFEFEIGLGGRTAEEVQSALERLRDCGHAPQLVTVSTSEDLDTLAAIARQYRVMLSFRYAGEPAGTAAKATAGRLNYHAATPAEAEEIAEQLVG